MSHELIQQLARFFVQREIENLKSVALKQGKSVYDFVRETFPAGMYCFVSLNTDVAYDFIINHSNERVKPTNRQMDSFIKQVNVMMNEWIDESCPCVAA